MTTSVKTLWESQFIEISNQTFKKSTIIENVYRPPKSRNEPTTFITEFTNILSSIQNKRNYCIYMWCLQHRCIKNSIKHQYNYLFFYNIMSLGFHPKISLTTRLGNNSHTLIDKTFTNNKDLDECSSI